MKARAKPRWRQRLLRRSDAADHPGAAARPVRPTGPALGALFLQEDLNFLLTNRVPRMALTRLMGWFSQIRSPLLARLSIALWRQFTELDLSEARKTRFESLHDCFIRELKPGARPFDTDADVLASPCDAIVGACGDVQGTQVYQAKGFPYQLEELFGGGHDAAALAEAYRHGRYATLRLQSNMYHRFHAPLDCEVRHVRYISGDTWNVNPIALQRVERLFCRNERAVIRCRDLQDASAPITLVPVAAILVASLRLHWLNVLLHLKYRGPNEIPCHASFLKGEEMGWFQHGSTIIVFAPSGWRLADGLGAGTRVRAGQALMRREGAG